MRWLSWCCIPLPGARLSASRGNSALISSIDQTSPSDNGKVDIGSTITAPVVHTTSVAVVPPDEAWPKIQAVRSLVRDKGLWRWPPHVNLLYPFVIVERFDEAAALLADRLAEVEPFTVTLHELKIFAHKRSATLWFAPETLAFDGEGIAPFQRLQAALQSAMPNCDAQTANHGGKFTPHLTVGHFPDEESASEARAMILESDICKCSILCPSSRTLSDLQ